MPIYEYRCHGCGRVFEELTLSAGTAIEVRCRHCDGTDVARLLSPFAVGANDPAAAAIEAGPCGGCGAAQRGACGIE
ncbi:zinc ribbon domain-containing protein [Candidatus Binatia bacterium]|nr:zinc ribbon domain-containing protein [Candidatus Binatia bacterium]